MINLTEDEIAFLEKMDKEKRQHAEAQKNYRIRKTQNDPEYREKLREYMKNFNEMKKNKYTSIKKKQLEEAPPKTVLIPSIKDDIIRNRRTRKGQKGTA